MCGVRPQRWDVRQHVMSSPLDQQFYIKIFENVTEFRFFSCCSIIQTFLQHSHVKKKKNPLAATLHKSPYFYLTVSVYRSKLWILTTLLYRGLTDNNWYTEVLNISMSYRYESATKADVGCNVGVQATITLMWYELKSGGSWSTCIT